MFNTWHGAGQQQLQQQQQQSEIAQPDSSTQRGSGGGGGGGGGDDRDSDRDGQPSVKRPRVRLSCLECRRRKLSCSRDVPCDRCVKSGTPERCSYEAGVVLGGGGGGGGPGSSLQLSDHASASPPAAPLPSSGLIRGERTPRAAARDPAPAPRPPRSEPSLSRGGGDAHRDPERVQRLEQELAQLKALLNKNGSLNGEGDDNDGDDDDSASQGPSKADAAEHGLGGQFILGKNSKTHHFGSHSAWSNFEELTEIRPSVRETAHQWLRPLDRAAREQGRSKKRQRDREKESQRPDAGLEALLPAKEVVDALVAVYLDQFEQMYRIVHVPTFEQQYLAFWDPTARAARSATTTALVLSMIAVSSCLDPESPAEFHGLKSTLLQRAQDWAQSVDEWLSRQSQKHRKLVHFQIACLLYLAKRVNFIKKKRFWVTSSSIIHEAIAVGLHQEPSGGDDMSPFCQELRTRLVSTMIEFNLQASFDTGVPNLLSQICDGRGPRNIRDEAFDEDSRALPASQPTHRFTPSSYLHLSRRSLQLRLEVTKMLTGNARTLDYDEAIRISGLIFEEIDALPTWNQKTKDHRPTLSYSLLHLQLKQYLIPLFQPFLRLRERNSKYQVAEFIFYNTAREMVLMHSHLYDQGVRGLHFLREDATNAASNLCSIILYQSPGSISLFAAHSRDTLELIEKCAMLEEDRIMRCGNNNPWGFPFICSTIGLLETVLDLRTSDAAKAACAERFAGLHRRLQSCQAEQQPSPAMSQSPMAGLTPPVIRSASSSHPAKQTGTPRAANPATPGSSATLVFGPQEGMPWRLPPGHGHSAQTFLANPFEVRFDMLGTELDGAWGGWAAGSEMG